MLQLYDLNKVKIQGLKQYKDMNIESILSTGDKTLSFLFPSNLSENIKEEGYIRTKTDEFVIKEITYNKEWKYIKATLNIEDLEGQPWEHFDTTGKTIKECLTLALAGTGWTIGNCNITKRRTVRKTNCSTWDIIQQAQKTYRVEISFDTLNKIVKVFEKLGSDKGVYFIDSLNLKDLGLQSNSYDYYTRIIAIGKDDLKVTVENYQYSNKKKTLIWKDERYTILESLREDAIVKLAEISKPYRAYSADIIDLASINDKYSILSYKLGDTITLISKEKSIKEKQRIVKITEYPQEPERNTCEISNTLLRFQDIQKEQQDTTETVNNITTDNGTVDGKSIDSIKTEQISDFEVNVGKITNLTAINARIDNLNVNKADIDSLNAVEIRTGNLIATKANITQLDAEIARINQLFIKTATIENLNATNVKIILLETKVGSIDTILSKEVFAELISVGKIVAGSAIIADGAITNAKIANGAITTALIGVGAVETAQIADASITDAKIVDLTANKITSGTIDANKINVKNLNAENITVGKINGVQIADNTVDTINIADSAVTGDKIVADAITAREIASKSITANEIASNTITAANIASGTITSNEIKAGSITTNSLSSEVGSGLDISSNTSIMTRVTNETFNDNINSINNTIEDINTTTSARIEKSETALMLTKEEIKLKASKTDLDDLGYIVSQNSASLTTLDDSFNFEISKINKNIDDTNEDMAEVKNNMTFDENGLTLGKTNNPFQITVDNDSIDFKDNGQVVAYINGQKMYIDKAEILSSLTVGVHQIEKYNNDTTLIKWVG